MLKPPLPIAQENGHASAFARPDDKVIMVVPIHVAASRPANHPNAWDAVQMDAPGAALAPTLSIARSGTDVTLTYIGTLQSSDSLPGSFTDVTGATSPYKTPIAGSQKFYRAVSK